MGFSNGEMLNGKRSIILIGILSSSVNVYLSTGCDKNELWFALKVKYYGWKMARSDQKQVDGFAKKNYAAFDSEWKFREQAEQSAADSSRK